ncbi:sulfatase-like hydrolase/transferase [Zavarzinella formosa]|uniref:sulfatase-like hydrolase/transferase n=1 Tax=Zavarzinella formosa TaxID=360055 RepID=UPI0002F9389C|nr:sulfatase-like hydrolase/transferase [Zavarzinella formosa]
MNIRWLLCCWLLAAGVLPAADRPNVLFILADDQRWDTIRALGNPEIQTPNLDQLAERGFVFRNAYCQGGMVPAVCVPSRTMLMTGRSLFHIPAGNAKTYDKPTLGGVFRQAGYATLFVGKRDNSFLAGNEAFEKVIYHTAPMTERAGQSRFMAESAIKWLKEQPAGKKPFFIYLGPPVPHDPRLAPEEFVKLYDPEKLTLSPNFMPQHPFDNGELKVRDELLAPIPRTPADMKKHLADYYATISNLDHHVGRIIVQLKESGELDKTIVVFTSDQGLAVGGRHGLMGKQNLYEHFKSPLIIAGPGIPKGKSDALAYLFDLFPTLCDATGTEIPKVCEGSSLMPVVTGKKAAVRETLFGAYRNCQRMVRDERWKLIAYNAGGDKHTQLFDLNADPDELKNLADEPAHKTTRERMEKLLAAERKKFGDPVDFDSQKK